MGDAHCFVGRQTLPVTRMAGRFIPIRASVPAKSAEGEKRGPPQHGSHLAYTHPMLSRPEREVCTGLPCPRRMPTRGSTILTSCEHVVLTTIPALCTPSHCFMSRFKQCHRPTINQMGAMMTTCSLNAHDGMPKSNTSRHPFFLRHSPATNS